MFECILVSFLMLIKFIFGGCGGGWMIVEYLIFFECQGCDYVLFEVVWGGMDCMWDLIDSIGCKWSYMYGVVSFVFEDVLSEDE